MKKLGIALVLATTIIATALIAERLAGERRTPSPPLAGWMANFTVAADARPASALAFVARDGKPHGLADFSGKIVLVNFWATWCAPCVRELPSLDRLQAMLAGADFTVLALSEDRQGWAVIEPFLARIDLKHLPIYLDRDGASAGALKVSALPSSVLFDRMGRALGRLEGHAEWDSPEAVALVRHYLAR